MNAQWGSAPRDGLVIGPVIPRRCLGTAWVECACVSMIGYGVAFWH